MRFPFAKLFDLKAGAAWLAAFVTALLVGGFLFVWSGVYSVAASRGHFPGFALLLEFAMRSSVRTHSFGIAVPDLTDAALAERGAAHFQGGCAPCHGAPGRPPNPIAEAMLPEPPNLSASVPTWQPNELYWIVKNGLKYTGMPAWPAESRDDEAWAMVAFLQRLPTMKADQYRGLAGLDAEQDVPAATLVETGPVRIAIAACGRCHGVDGRGRASRAFPRLDIQPADYLLAQLLSYAEGSRHSGFMQPVAAELDGNAMRNLAEYYASQQAGQKAEAGGAGLGHRLATTGLPEQGIPACLSCHAESSVDRNPLYPAIVGQYSSYTSGQLQLFKTDKRRGTPAAEIMSVVARRLTDQQIEAVADFLAGAQP